MEEKNANDTLEEALVEVENNAVVPVKQKRNVKQIVANTILIALIVVTLVILFCLVIPAFKLAPEIGAEIYGTIYGTATGITDGISEGKEEGLSAQDTEVKIKNTITAQKKLDVLEVKTTINDNLKLGKKDKEKYSSSLVYKVTAHFSIDLSSAKVSLEDDKLVITVPEPNVENITLDSTPSELYSMEGLSLTLSANDGYEALINSTNEILKMTAEKLNNYDQLLEQAEFSAKTQIKSLVDLATVDVTNVDVVFESEGK